MIEKLLLLILGFLAGCQLSPTESNPLLTTDSGLMRVTVVAKGLE